MSIQLLKEIEITEMKGLRIGNVQNDEAQTGVTVLLFDQMCIRDRSKAVRPSKSQK